MRFPSLLSLTMAAAVTAVSPPPCLAAAEAADKPKENGFVRLFDGKTLNGWVKMNGAKFSVDDGVLKLNGGRGWLRSEREYADFILKLEVRWLKPKQDSGVFLRAGKEGNNWPNRRYEVQCENSKRVARIFGAPHKRDVKLAYYQLKDKADWNTFEIQCVGKRCQVKLNGKLVTTSTGFKHSKGYIGFQGEGGLLEFRNIRIKVLESQ